MFEKRQRCVNLHRSIRPRCTLAVTALACIAGAAAEAPAPPTMASVLEASTAADWRRPDPEYTLYLELSGGRVIIEMAPQFAPKHAANIRTLARQGYWDGLAILRSQDNYVVQWGDPNAENAQKRRDFGKAAATLPPEFAVDDAGDLSFTALPDTDVYAPQTGLAYGFHAARDPQSGSAWLSHCYGAVGAGRGGTADSGSGAELYVVIGHSPRHLDRNITLVGRVLQGMERLSVLPRGTGALGFYEKPEQYVPIQSIRLAADLPPAQRSSIEVLRTDTSTFLRLIEARRQRREEWFLDPVGHVELCNVPVPVRTAK